MFKGFSRLWWRGAKSINKAQHAHGNTLLKALLAPPAKRRRPKASAAKPVTRKKAAGHAPAAARPTPPTPKGKEKGKAEASLLSLPGKWLAGYYHSAPGNGKLAGRRMSYWLYLPHSTPAAGLPLVVMLHGCNQTATQFAQGTRMNRLAEEKGFAVLYPQQSLREHPLRCWHWYEKSIQSGGGDIQLIAGTIAKVAQQYGFDKSRIYAAGLSAGAAMAHILALTHPRSFAAVGLHSGPVYGSGHTPTGAYAVMQTGSAMAAVNAMDDVSRRLGLQAKTPAILLHGQSDKVVRPINQLQLAQQFRILNQLGPENATPIVLKPAGRSKNNPYRMQDYTVGRKPLLRVCEIANLEHAWSGGDCSLQYNACAGPDASKMMWDFFSRHRLPPA